MTASQEFHTVTPEALAPARLLRSLGLEPRKRLGQNFLASKTALRQILLSLEIQPGQVVIEIGPGLGTLTGYLAVHAEKVLAVELDTNLASYLQDRFAAFSQVEVIQGDILRLTPSDLLPDGGQRYKVVGNLPYYITSAALRHVLWWAPRPERVVVMVQEEVARRMTASAGEMSLLSLMVQLHGIPEIAALVPAGAFVPRPKVDSAIVKIVPHRHSPASPDEENRLFRLARAAFQQRRKMLLNSLRTVLPFPKEKIGQLLAQTGIPQAARAQDLGLEQWLALVRAAATLTGSSNDAIRTH